MVAQLFFSLLPSEISRLVLGYLAEIGCYEAGNTLFMECSHLSEMRGQFPSAFDINCRVGGISLLEILDDYVNTINLINGELEARCPGWTGTSKANHLGDMCRPGQAAESLQNFLSKHLPAPPRAPTPQVCQLQTALPTFSSASSFNPLRQTRFMRIIPSGGGQISQFGGPQLRIAKFCQNVPITKPSIVTTTLRASATLAQTSQPSTAQMLSYPSLKIISCSSRRKRQDKPVHYNLDIANSSTGSLKDSFLSTAVNSASGLNSPTSEVDFEKIISALLTNAETVATRINTTLTTSEMASNQLSSPIQSSPVKIAPIHDEHSIMPGSNLDGFIDDLLKDIEDGKDVGDQMNVPASLFGVVTSLTDDFHEITPIKSNQQFVVPPIADKLHEITPTKSKQQSVVPQIEDELHETTPINSRQTELQQLPLQPNSLEPEYQLDHTEGDNDFPVSLTIGDGYLAPPLLMSSDEEEEENVKLKQINEAISSQVNETTTTQSVNPARSISYAPISSFELTPKSGQLLKSFTSMPSTFEFSSNMTAFPLISPVPKKVFDTRLTPLTPKMNALTSVAASEFNQSLPMSCLFLSPHHVTPANHHDTGENQPSDIFAFNPLPDEIQHPISAADRVPTPPVHFSSPLEIQHHSSQLNSFPQAIPHHSISFMSSNPNNVDDGGGGDYYESDMSWFHPGLALQESSVSNSTETPTQLHRKSGQLRATFHASESDRLLFPKLVLPSRPLQPTSMSIEDPVNLDPTEVANPYYEIVDLSAVQRHPLTFSDSIGFLNTQMRGRGHSKLIEHCERSCERLLGRRSVCKPSGVKIISKPITTAVKSSRPNVPKVALPPFRPTRLAKGRGGKRPSKIIEPTLMSTYGGMQSPLPARPSPDSTSSNNLLSPNENLPPSYSSPQFQPSASSKSPTCDEEFSKSRKPKRKKLDLSQLDVSGILSKLH